MSQPALNSAVARCHEPAVSGHVARGAGGAVATAHPAATQAALDTLARGGSAVDAAIAAQAVVATVMPEAAGLGGDLLALVHRPGCGVLAVNGVGKAPAIAPDSWTSDGGGSVTVPGLVDGWATLHAAAGRLSLAEDLAPAMRLAEGATIDSTLASALAAQRSRLERNGALSWALLNLDAGQTWRQPELHALLGDIGELGSAAFYAGGAATAIATAVARSGGTLSARDLRAHRTSTPQPVEVPWGDGTLFVQPPPAQGVLLAMAAAWLDRNGPPPAAAPDHILVELTDAAFAYRSSVATRGHRLLEVKLAVDFERASRRGGPRSYLHTAGVAVADADGMVVSSLISVFDDFGSAVYVPELGIVLGNRAAGFTDGDNSPSPGRYPVHTLAPALIADADGSVTALATPGADGQVQTLLQILAARRYRGEDWPRAIAGRRWRSQDGQLLVEEGHPASGELRTLGHDIVPRAHGDPVFGAVVVAGTDSHGPFAAADPRRNVNARGRS